MVKRGRIVAFFLLTIVFAGIIGYFTPGVSKGISLGLDLQGGFEVLYEAKPIEEGQEITSKVMDATVQNLENRVNILGVNETTIEVEEGNRIRVQLAGIQDQNEARELLQTEARLSFRDVNDKEYLNGNDIKEGSAAQSFDQFNRPNVTLELKDASKFYEVTKEIASMYPNNKLVIWMDFDEEIPLKKKY